MLTGHRRRAALLAVSLSATLLALGIAEIGVRVLDVKPAPLAPLPLKRFALSTNPILRWEHQPNAVDELVRVNPDGFGDDRVYSPARERGRFRVVVLGDSVTSFMGGTGDNWTEVLERRLNGAMSGAPEVEIINMAVGGYDTWQEVEYLKVHGLKYNPDLVVVGFCVNDHYPLQTGGQLEKLLEINPSFRFDERAFSLKHSLLKHSRLAFALYHRLFGRERPAESDRMGPTSAGGGSQARLGFEELVALKERHGFALMVVSFPVFSGGVPLDHDAPGTVRLHAIAEELGIDEDVISTRGAFGGEGVVAAYDRVHLTKTGHRAVALYLEPIFDRRIRGATGATSAEPGR